MRRRGHSAHGSLHSRTARLIRPSITSFFSASVLVPLRTSAEAVYVLPGAALRCPISLTTIFLFMACTPEFVDFVAAQLADAGAVRVRKMFGDHLLYVDEKPAVLLCDNVAYVKMHPVLEAWMADAETGHPYPGAKLHYILDVEHRAEALRVVKILAEVLPLPTPRRKAKK